MKIAFLYAGQGSQKVGMGKDFYETYPLYQKVIDELDPEYKEIMHEGPKDKLNQTRYTQPCMGAFAAGITALLHENRISADYLAGLSLGEYGALHAAGVFDAKTLVNLLAYRGIEMEQAGKGIAFKMEAVIGLPHAVIEAICMEIEEKESGYVRIANYNYPLQYVICGDKNAVESAQEKLQKAGAKRCIPLNVSGPFHSKYMKPAGEALKRKFSEIEFQELTIPIVCNVTGEIVKDKNKLKELLEKQVSSSVHFEESIQTLLNQGVDTFIEIGPGRVLSGFVKKIDRSVSIYQIETVEEFVDVMDKLEERKND